MITVNYTKVSENLKKYCDKVITDNETIVVLRKNNKNVVMLLKE